MRNTANAHILTTALLTGLVMASSPASLVAQDTEAEDYGYGYYRTVEGEVLITGLEEDAEPLEVEPNYPVLTGDRLWIAEGSRLEAVLPDRSVVRIGQETMLFFHSLEGAADAPEGATTAIRLVEGELQLAADEYVLSQEPVEVETENSRVYLHLPGTYRLTSDGRGWTEVVVRKGFAEVNTDRGSVVARDGESVEVDGEQRPDVRVARAGRIDELESWGSELSGDRLAQAGYVDDSLAYAAAPLDSAGHWVSVSGSWAWRPSVRAGWRPFTDGWWTHTPSGLSWVAYEPWGWLTSHYGAWDYMPGHGWLWYPGTVYSPAWVYWYWGPTHSAWIPSGYYTRYYGSRYGGGFRFGVYGWAGGYWDSWSHWTFCPTRYFGHRQYRSYWRSGREMHRDGRLRAVPRGVITTDTRDVSPRRWGKPSEIVEALERRHGQGAGATRSLGDVTPFVERRANLPEDTKRMIQSDAAPRSGTRSSGSRSGYRDDSGAKVMTSPWRVQRPEAIRSGSSGSEAPRTTGRRATGTATDWELIERLRRFENKHEDGPRTSPEMGGTDGEQQLRRVVPRSETPTRRILEGVRSRNPAGVDRKPAPTTGREQPTTRSASPQRRKPTTSATSGSRSGSGSRSTVRSAPSSSRSGSSGKSMRSSGGSSKSKPAAKSRSKARKRKN